ncbi:MAG: PIG-L family deacetylase [Nitrospirae bacterium]|nr:PIG-L family deacetylase [Nitrospirota bacterium]MBF0534732.1 PIG-L family deacetylase [Nitrospirota bacterium]MBF0616406.1 PIG-L family deacetylase [Nitrospirota bacterium]
MIRYNDDETSVQISDKKNIPIGVDDSGKPFFVISKIRSNDFYDGKDKSDQFVTTIPDPLGINGETLIGQRRSERSFTGHYAYVPMKSFDEDTVRMLFPLFVRNENLWMLGIVIENIESSDFLLWISEQLEVMYKSAIIAEEERVILDKKLMLNPFAPQELIERHCEFCNIDYRDILENLRVHNGTFAINYKYSFGPIFHKILIVKRKEGAHDVANGIDKDIFYLYELLHSITRQTKDEQDLLDGVSYGMNYGMPRLHRGVHVPSAGASQIHIHSQVLGLVKNSFNTADKLGLICEGYYKKHNRDYLEDYMTLLREANLVIEENNDAILYVPIAQRFNNELQIMLKNPIGNILETTQSSRMSLAKLERLALNLYGHPEINVRSFNTLMYATRFSSDNEFKQRLILSICPRNTIIAFLELSGRYVVDELPWYCAARLNSVKHELSTRGAKKLNIMFIGAHPDDIELGCGGTIKKLKTCGHKVISLIVTDGCAGNRTPDMRAEEARESAGFLGIDEVYFCGIRDSQTRLINLYDVLLYHISRYSPDVIFTHAGLNEHTDHQSINEVVQTIWANRLKTKPHLLLFEIPVYSESEVFSGNVFVDIDIDTKMKAVEKYRSEVTRGSVKLSDVKERAEKRAKELGQQYDYCEAFVYKGRIEELIKVFPFIATVSSHHS